MIINNSKTEESVVDFEKEAKVYLLSADEIRSKDINFILSIIRQQRVAWKKIYSVL